MRPSILAVLLLALAGCTASGHMAAGEAQPTEDRLLFFEDGDWQPHSRTLYTYAGASGEATEVLEQRWEDDGWVDEQKQTWSVDALGRQAEGTFSSWEDGTWSVFSRAQFTYDSAGHKVLGYRIYLDPSGSVSAADSLVSTFDEEGLETERRFYRRQDGETAEVLRQRSEYDARGREVTRLHLGQTAGAWVEDRRWTFTYRSDDQRATGQVEVMENGRWLPERSETYVYDDRDRLVRLDADEWADGTWRPFVRRETRYGTN
jgi:hypothetical protein